MKGSFGIKEGFTLDGSGGTEGRGRKSSHTMAGEERGGGRRDREEFELAQKRDQREEEEEEERESEGLTRRHRGE